MVVFGFTAMITMYYYSAWSKHIESGDDWDNDSQVGRMGLCS